MSGLVLSLDSREDFKGRSLLYKGIYNYYKLYLLILLYIIIIINIYINIIINIK
jgi:hypothetical protein